MNNRKINQNNINLNNEDVIESPKLSRRKESAADLQKRYHAEFTRLFNSYVKTPHGCKADQAVSVNVISRTKIR